ncbi:MAG TPA: aminomethyl-transferring glycine dehydrogenase [Bacteroidales bacterium]|nr:aminomethyl-transferring glycine dehydrogenase [Bacteroidales bacterium]
MAHNEFLKRHIGPSTREVEMMLAYLGMRDMDHFLYEILPDNIRLQKPLNLPQGMSEHEYLNHLREVASRNQLFKTYIGLGYYNTITPSVIQRNVLENPGWYTAYTPYQAEISQGRLEALLNFQTMVSDLTGLPIANASLLDEATAAAEAMIMFYNARSRQQVKAGANRFFVSDGVFPQTLDVIQMRAEPLGIEVIVGSFIDARPDSNWFGALLQYPDQYGQLHDNKSLVQELKQAGVQVAVAADLLSLVLITPPGEWGADVAVGTTQRFGIPLGYGGPHAAFFATTDAYKRSIPGRIIGVSKDNRGRNALRMALQTREQHIKRERATSNICTAQALLATMAGFYAAYHGPEGLRAIAKRINSLANELALSIAKAGYRQLNTHYFDTLKVAMPEGFSTATLRVAAEGARINFRYIDDRHFGISLDETTTSDDLAKIVHVLSSLTGRTVSMNSKPLNDKNSSLSGFERQSEILTHPVFNTYHSETDMMRYMKRLENRDLALNRTMIPLGSCTMKLNAATQLFSLTWPEFAQLHPFVPAEQAEGYAMLIDRLEKDLAEITGFSAVSFMPNSGASGEYTGLLVIRAYHQSRGEGHRRICLIPSSAHGTNPASAVMAGMEVVVVKCDEYGNVDLDDLRQKAETHADNLAAVMVTYPSTHGVFEKGITELIEIVHAHGGQVYMDGANMNAQVGLTSPGFIGADVCHLNLHKTFAIPHGGGGPGVGPIGVAAHLKPFLPGHPLVKTGGTRAIKAVSSAPFGSALILPISYAYIKLLGAEGLTYATKIAILNANYMKERLKDYYPILYTGNKGTVAHEMILDCNQFSRTADITVVDIAKRLMDYGFHAPTVAFPVHGTLMVEPTESEPLSEMNRFVEAMIAIRAEIAEVEEGKAEKHNNVVSNAPHSLDMILADEWTLPYSREKAAAPLKELMTDKYFVPVSRIDDAYGDRNLVCTCLPMEAYENPVPLELQKV